MNSFSALPWVSPLPQWPRSRPISPNRAIEVFGSLSIFMIWSGSILAAATRTSL